MNTRTPGQRRTLWLAWIALSTGLIVWMSYAMLKSDDRTLFMPGPLTGGHHQLELACESCHIPMSGGITYSVYGEGGHLSFGRNPDGRDTLLISADHMVADGDLVELHS